MKAAARVLSKSEDWSFAARDAASMDKGCHLVKNFFLQKEFATLAVFGCIFPRRMESEAVVARSKVPAVGMSEMERASSHSAPGMVGGSLALGIRRRKHMAPGAILRRPLCCNGRDPQGEDLHVPRPLCPVCSVWPGVRGRAVAGELIFPSSLSSALVRHLRSRGNGLKWPAADEPGTHSFRRGAARSTTSAVGLSFGFSASVSGAGML